MLHLPHCAGTGMDIMIPLGWAAGLQVGRASTATNMLGCSPTSLPSWSCRATVTLPQPDSWRRLHASTWHLAVSSPNILPAASCLSSVCWVIFINCPIQCISWSLSIAFLFSTRPPQSSISSHPLFHILDAVAHPSLLDTHTINIPPPLLHNPRLDEIRLFGCRGCQFVVPHSGMSASSPVACTTTSAQSPITPLVLQDSR